MNAVFDLPKLDEAGYLLEPEEWSEALAEYLAQLENITLTEAHWEAIRFMRAYYAEHHAAPDARTVIKHLFRRLSGDARNELFNMFIFGYVTQACRIAGMRRPQVWGGY